MLHEARRLVLGAVLIAAAAIALLLSSPDKSARSSPAKLKRIELLAYSASPISEDSVRGFRAGLVEPPPRGAGMIEGEDFEIVERNAQGDMATLRILMREAVARSPDLIATVSTPPLQTAVAMVKDQPVVFMTVANAVLAGAGKSNKDHLPNITGVHSEGAYLELAKLVQEIMPQCKRVGTLYTPSEVNSEYSRDRQREALASLGIEMVAKPADNASEAPQAAEALMASNIDAVMQISDNLVGSCFPAIARAARAHRKPVFAYVSTQLKQGAFVVLARDYSQIGTQAAAQAVRVLAGESPASMEFEMPRITTLLIDEAAAQELGVAIPPSVLARVNTQVISNPTQPTKDPAK